MPQSPYAEVTAPKRRGGLGRSLTQHSKDGEEAARGEEEHTYLLGEVTGTPWSCSTACKGLEEEAAMLGVTPRGRPEGKELKPGEGFLYRPSGNGLMLLRWCS